MDKYKEVKKIINHVKDIETTCDEGYTCLSADGSTITIATTYDADESALSNEVEVE